MAITQIIGKSGQGKTTYQSKLILGEVQVSPRPVLSNIPMDFGFWKFWLFQIVPVKEILYYYLGRFYWSVGYARYFSSDDSIFVYKQIEVCYDWAIMTQWANALNDEEYKHNVYKLIRYRLEGKYDEETEQPFTDYEALKQYPLDRQKVINGFIWSIDELASYFSARNYRATPPQFLQLLTQHRKMRIDLIGTTQRYTSIDTWFRELAHNVFLVRKSAWIPRLHTVFTIDFDEISGAEITPRRTHTRFFRTKRLHSVFDTNTLVVGRQKVSLIQTFDSIEDKNYRKREVIEYLQGLPELSMTEPLPHPSLQEPLVKG